MKAGVREIRIDRAHKLNALDRDQIDRVRREMESASVDADARVVVLRGAGGRSFVGGADLHELVALDPESARAFITALHEMIQAVRDCPVPVIAAIDGFCIGAGMELAAACDIRVASEDASFAMPEVKVGIPSVIEAVLLPRLIGWGRTSYLVMTGETIDAVTADHWGFLERLVPADEFEAAVEAVVDAILESGPRAVRDQKALTRRWEGVTLDQAIQAGIDAFGKAFEADEPAEYLGRAVDRLRRR